MHLRPRRPPPPRALPSFLLRALLLCIALSAILHILLSSFLPFPAFPAFPAVPASPNSSSSPRPQPPACHIIGHPSAPHFWQPNSRIVCRFETLCLSHSQAPVYVTALPSVCHLSTLRFRPRPQRPLPPSFTSCPQVAHRLVLSALTTSNRTSPIFPTPAHRLTTTSIIVPNYPFQNHIYHYANQPTQVAHVVDHLRALVPHLQTPLNIIFQGPRPTLPWQRGLLQATLIHRIRPLFPDTRLHFLHPHPNRNPHPRHICASSPIVLGKWASPALWPLPNDTSVSPAASAIPVQALRLKRAVFNYAAVNCTLPAAHRGLTCLPPLTLGYATRPSTALRSFDALDEQWFSAMLAEEAAKHRFLLKTIVTSANQSFQHQVRTFARLGFVVGIHGANLVNSIFMPPFSALVELFPARSSSMCYYAGSNSGIFYQSHRARMPASAEESGCRRSFRCWTDRKHRRVKIATKKDRLRIRDMVRNGMRHVRQLHTRFPHGVPVYLDEQRDAYLIDDAP